jgi:hypothetical protein
MIRQNFMSELHTKMKLLRRSMKYQLREIQSRANCEIMMLGDAAREREEIKFQLALKALEIDEGENLKVTSLCFRLFEENSKALKKNLNKNTLIS